MTGQLIGYIRVSTIDQNTGRQEDQLGSYHLDEVFVDHASGKDKNRPQLDACLRYVRKGDTLVVASMDRLARSLPDLRSMVDDLTGRGVTVTFDKESLTFAPDAATDPFSTLMLNLLGAFAEFERALMLERQREGIALAKADGKYKGRKPALTDAQVTQVVDRLAGGESAAALAREFGVSRATVYNARDRVAVSSA